MRPLRSLAYRTDAFVARFDGVVVDRGRYVLVQTPSNPYFWWGNLLIYPNAPDANATTRGHDGSWLDDFTREFPGRRGMLFGWDCPDGERGAADVFVEQGFTLDESSVLTAMRVDRTPRHNDDVRVEPLVSEASWNEAGVALVKAFSTRRLTPADDLQHFVDRQLQRYRAMQDKALGQWYGAYLGGKLAGALGLVRAEGVGRFQLVGTDPDFARQGVCSTLLYEVARRGLEEQRLGTLVIAVDATSHAAHVYTSVGFRQAERLFAVIRRS